MPETELRGRVKWFDPKKGYGFVETEGGPDYLLHANKLPRERGESPRLPLGGETVLFEPARTSSRVEKVVAIDWTTATVPPSPTRRACADVKKVGEFEHAELRRIDRARGFGFLTRGTQFEDIFIHMETLRRCGMYWLQPGDAVMVRYGEGPKGLVATELRAIEPVEGTRNG